MFRSFALLCFAAVFAFSVVFAQDESDAVKIKATPEVLSLFDESLQSLAQAEPNPRIGGLFRLLGFAVHLDDKAPAQRVIDALLALAPSIEPDELRYQLYMGIANALCDVEKYLEAVDVLNRITDPAIQSEAQLNIAVKIVIELEQNNALPPFDASPLLRQAIASTVESQNVVMEALARTFLGHELARQGKQAESAAAFAEAMQTAQKIEDAEEKGDVVGLILRRQAEYDQVAAAMAMFQSVAPEIKPAVAFALVSALIQEEKYTEAEALIKTLPSGDMRNDLLGNFVMVNIKTITDEKIGELLPLVSTDEFRERFLQVIAGQLQKNGRSDAASQVAERLSKPAIAEMSLFVGKIEALLEGKKFAEAVRLLEETENSEAIRQHLKRQILMMQYQEAYEESVTDRIAETFSSNERIAVAELREEAKRAAASDDFEERIDLLFEVFQEQSRFLDFAGARQTLKLVAEQFDASTQPIQIVSDRLLLARLQVELRDKEGAIANLGKLLQTLSAVRDLSELKHLVPTSGDDPAESAIRNQLFQIYLITTNLLSRADAPAESQAAFAKARELAKAEPVAVARAEKLLTLAQTLAESSN